MTRNLVLVICLAAIAGCGGTPRIDGSSEAAFESSVEKVSDSLPNEKKMEFAIALLAISMSHAGELLSDPANIDEASQTAMAEKVITELDGLTADEVIAKANALGK
jgi:hypothetical protein